MAEHASLITALFTDSENAEHAYTSVTDRGYAPADLRLLMTAETRERLLAAAVRRREGAKAINALVTALVGAGIPAERARLYDGGLNAGGIVMGLTPSTRQEAEQIERAWNSVGGCQILCPLLRRKDAA